jgi:hypothetical protein
MFIGGEQDFAAVGREGGSEAGAPEIGDRPGATAIGIGNHNLHLHRRGEVIRQQRFVPRQGIRGLRIVCSPHQFPPVARENSAAIIADFFRDLLLVGTVGFHRPQVQVAGGQRGVDNGSGFPVNGCFSVVAGCASETADDLAGVGGEIDVAASWVEA